MRSLTIRPRLGDASIKLIEDIIGQRLPVDFSDFMKKNAGLNHYECIYTDEQGTHWSVSQYNMFNDLYGLTKEFLKAYDKRMIPFAYDPGGWHFCLCMDAVDTGAIYIHRWTDHVESERFLKIATSFENFINELQKDEQE